jgi:hypothetical protein
MMAAFFATSAGAPVMASRIFAWSPAAPAAAAAGFAAAGFGAAGCCATATATTASTAAITVKSPFRIALPP